MASDNLMEGGFGNAFEHPQYGYANPIETYSDLTPKSNVTVPDGPMWAHTYDTSDPAVTLYSDNGYGVAFDDTYNGVFDVDQEVDTLAEYNLVVDAEDA